MSEIKGNKKIVGKINAKTLRATANVPDWLQPLIKENGVYVGTEEPTDPEKLVWINPDGEASDLDLSNYYTKDETDSLIDTAVQNIDLSSYATKVELENYDTSEQVDAKINAIEIPEVDLSDYAKKSDIPDVSGFITQIPSEYVTETELNAKGYLTEHQSLEGYAKTTDIPDVSGFALKSEIPSTDGLATEEYVNNAIANIETPEGIQHITITDATELLNLETGLYIVDNGFTVNTLQGEYTFSGTLSVKQDWYSYAFINSGTALIYNYEDATWNYFQLAYESDIPDVSGFALKTEIPSIEGLATETYVQEKIAAIPEVDLSSYALKSEIPTVPTKTSDLTNDSGFITSADIPEVDLSSYALKTEIPDVSAFQTQEQVIALIQEYGGGGSLPASEEVGF